MKETQCRVCLQCIDCTFKLDDKVKEWFIWEALNNIANVSIAVGDSLPQSICCTCFNTLDLTIGFKLEIENSENILRQRTDSK